MTENKPNTGPDNPSEDVDETRSVKSDLADEVSGTDEAAGIDATNEEPDLLFAHINALMDGSETPVAEPINLDDYDYQEDQAAPDPVVETENPSMPVEDSFLPESETDDYFQDSDELPVYSPERDVETAGPTGDTQELNSGLDDFFEDLDEPATALVTPVIASGRSTPDHNAKIIELGFYGKLPTYGDFIQKRLPQNFINPWHEWLQTGMLANRERDPQGWKTYYLNCPAWCFVLGRGICGDQPVAGVTIPSVDRVGRYFNFTMASILPEDTDPAVFAAARDNWFTNLESFALSVLDQEMDQDSIDRTINELSIELSWGTVQPASFESGNNNSRILIADAGGTFEFVPALLHQVMARDYESYGLWWHKGSSQATAQMLVCPTMPEADSYLDLIMDRDLRDTVNTASQEPEMDYLDELLSD